MIRRVCNNYNKIMNGYSFRNLARSGALALALVACGADQANGGGDQPIAADRAPMQGQPVVQGLGPDEAVPADTIDLRKIGYSLGAADAPVVVYEFSDFGCPFCAMFAQGTLPELKRDFIDTGKVRWTYVPFVMGMFPNGAESARASECAAEQDRFWDMHDLLYENQQEWKSSRGPEELFNGYAARLGLDEGQFAACYRENRGGARTALNNRAADALRIRATPSFFINGRLVEGALPVEQFRQILTILSSTE